MSGYPPNDPNWYPTYEWASAASGYWFGSNQGLPDSLANQPSNPSLNTHNVIESTFIPNGYASLDEAEHPGFHVQTDVPDYASPYLLHKGHSPTTTIGGPQVSPPSRLGILAQSEEIEDPPPHQPHIFPTTERKISESHGNSADHESIQPAKSNACLQCNQSFRSTTELGHHARQSQHAAFKCKCGTTFQGIYDLKRHQDRHQPGTPAYPCLYCSRHRGESGFRRKDHLTQHIRNYHHITSDNSEDEYRQKKKEPSLVCPYPHSGQLNNRGLGSSSASEISNSEGRQNFTTKKQFIQHMRIAHNESPFECKVENCDRIGSRGYVREGDLRNHYAKAH